MKKINLILCSATLLALLFTSASHAQSHQGYYMHIDYVQIDQQQIQSFENNIPEVIKPIQQDRIEAEKLKEWYLYRVTYPGSRNTQYNYVVISISDDISGFDNQNEGSMGDYLEHIIPNHSELWRINNSVLSSENAKPSRYFGMDYMRVRSGMEYAYQMMEDEIARPLHELRMEMDRMKGWELFSLITPGGTEYGYNFATGNYYNYLKNIEFGFTEELINQSHPDTNINEFFDNIEQTRDLVRSEIWELITYVK